MAAAGIVVGKGQNVEDRRVKWTTYYNLKTWFNSWQKELIELGFAHFDTKTKLYNVCGANVDAYKSIHFIKTLLNKKCLTS